MSRSLVALETPRRDHRGSTSTEYALLLSLIALILLAGVTLFGTRTTAMYEATCAELTSSGSSC